MTAKPIDAGDLAFRRATPGSQPITPAISERSPVIGPRGVLPPMAGRLGLGTLPNASWSLHPGDSVSGAKHGGQEVAQGAL